MLQNNYHKIMLTTLQNRQKHGKLSSGDEVVWH